MTDREPFVAGTHLFRIHVAFHYVAVMELCDDFGGCRRSISEIE